jgi:CRISPR-associated protein Cas1
MSSPLSDPPEHDSFEALLMPQALPTDETPPMARAFVSGKVRNCRTLLRRNLETDPAGVLDRLGELATAAESAASLETLLGAEGMAAKLYFAAFATLLKNGFAFDGRNRRPPRDPVNATLSFLYALLAKECYVAVMAAGLDPLLGFLHKPRYGRPSLALDLAEEFRPLLADSATLAMLNTGEVKEEHFVVRAGACGLTPAGRRAVLGGWERRLQAEVTHPIFHYALSYRRVIALQARLLVRALLGEIPAYPPFKTR